MNIQDFHKAIHEGESTPKQPLVFIGHGDPMNALRENDFTRALNNLGNNLVSTNKPKAVLCVSAHWLTKGTFINSAENPPTIHDFGGFPQELFDVQYPAKGSPEKASEAQQLIEGSALTQDWGLDHGAWTVLKHVFPNADIPVFQMSIDYYKSMDYHFELAAKLQSLREKGVLIVGSGNVVHNLQMSFPRFADGNTTPFDWAVEFDTWVGNCILDCNWKALTKYDTTSAGKLSVPTPDHYAPLMYVMGLAGGLEPIETLYQSVEYGGMSMRTFKIG
ncbi:MAG: 4,5-DOPA dioxygenase extradiol [Bacteroidetes bacterium]|nr:4,5-DOPA dioxygenase extradiol [Bacteroidota bacterium]